MTVLRRSALLLLALAGIAIATAATTHKVRKGDTLSKIAEANGVTIAAIQAANRIRDEDSIIIGQVLKIPSAAPSFIEYKIKKGDSLSSIADKHGLSATKLAAYNRIRNPNKIVVGHTIRIPVSAGAAHGPQLAGSIESALENVRVRSGQWKKIIIHHTATDQGNPKGIDRVHREEQRMENGLAYHFLIGNGHGMGNGEIHIGDRWKRQIQGGHMKSQALNEIAIGVCLVGNFENAPPSSAQMEQLIALLDYLGDRCRIRSSQITTHTLAHPNHTDCPGKRFDLAAVKRGLER